MGSSAATNYRPDLGRQDLNWISPDQIERIEVVRGPMSSLYGSDAMGGVINIITRRIGDEWNGSATHSYTRPGDGKRGDTQQIGATFSGPLGERFGLRIGANSMRRVIRTSPTTVSTAMPTPARRTALSMRCCSGS